MAMATTTLPADSLDPSLHDGLLEYFPSSLMSPDSAPLLAEVVSILRIYNLTPSDLADKWESFCLNKKHLLAEVEDGDPFNLENVRELKKHIQEGLERESRAKKHNMTNLGTPAPRAGKAGMADDIFAAISPQTPMVKRKVSAPMTTPIPKSRLSEVANVTPTVSSPLAAKSTGDTPFAQRKQPGALLQTLNQQIPLPELHSIDEVGQIPFTVNVDMKKFGFRTMHQSLMTASEVLDDRIDSMAEILQEQYNIPEEDFNNPSRVSPVTPSSVQLMKNEIVAVGRICLDPPTTTARPTATSLVLETSRRLGAGARVPLDLSSIPSFSLFPGQVIGVKAINASGSYLAVKEILLPQRLPCPDITSSDLLTRGMRMIVASGPWGTDTGGWEGFEEICQVTQSEQPDVLILMGPFIDEAHPNIQNGTINLPDNVPPTMESLFKQEISCRLRQITDTQVILIPHVRDIISSHAVWPQEAFSRQLLDLPKNVRCLTNPTVFGLGETTIGVSTNDILRGISLEECTRNPVNTGLYDRLPNYIMQQRHFYPLFPARPEARVALQESGLGEFVGVTPDILLLPSELQYFTKVVDGVVVVNPGGVSKKASAGTFARVYIAPKDQSGSMDLDSLKADVWERCRVDIYRI